MSNTTQVVISKELHQLLKRIAVQTGTKLYIVCEVLIKQGLEAQSAGKVMSKTKGKKILKQAEEVAQAVTVSILEDESSSSGNRGVSPIDLKF